MTQSGLSCADMPLRNLSFTRLLDVICFPLHSPHCSVGGLQWNRYAMRCRRSRAWRAYSGVKTTSCNTLQGSIRSLKHSGERWRSVVYEAPFTQAWIKGLRRQPRNWERITRMESAQSFCHLIPYTIPVLRPTSFISYTAISYNWKLQESLANAKISARQPCWP